MEPVPKAFYCRGSYYALQGAAVPLKNGGNSQKKTGYGSLEGPKGCFIPFFRLTPHENSVFLEDLYLRIHQCT